jgi:hypothetical protein
VNILALDLGTKTGWALHDNIVSVSGVQTFDLKRGESPGMRYVRFTRWLGDMCVTKAEASPDLRCYQVRYKPDLIVYEQTHQRGGAAPALITGGNDGA